jgi:hypothetical protein
MSGLSGHFESFVFFRRYPVRGSPFPFTSGCRLVRSRPNNINYWDKKELIKAKGGLAGPGKAPHGVWETIVG